MAQASNTRMEPMDFVARALAYPGAVLDYPFGETPACVKVGGRIFLQAYSDGRLTLKCEPGRALFYRTRYAPDVVRGYHCPPVQQPYYNTVTLGGNAGDADILEMLGHAYAYTVSRLSRAAREELLPPAPTTADAGERSLLP